MKYIQHAMKNWPVFIVLLFLLSVPSFFRMVRPGVFSMQDFPYFRIVEYSKCLADFQIPCRWAPDAGAGYGEPVFNFYSHVPFLLGSLVHLVGFSFQFSLKSVFALSLFGSFFSMFFLAKHLWNDRLAALFSAVLYLYAPYRALNVWVRGALPESLVFMIIPIIFLFFEKYLDGLKQKYLILFSLSLALLVLTHNLSVLMYAPLFVIYILFRVGSTKKWKIIVPLFVSGIFALLLSAFYLLPAVFESRYIDLAKTTHGYFDFRAHFVTLSQLFLLRFWGYGGSTWGDQDGLSLAIGHIQWVVALIVLFFSMNNIRNRRGRSAALLPIVLVLMGGFYLFLTHNKSTFIWEGLSSLMSYIQFPWRFLGPALFCFSLSSGSLGVRLNKKLVTFIILMVVVFNFGFFKEDIWYTEPDSSFLTGSRWELSEKASLPDYWTVHGKLPSGDETFGVTQTKKTTNEQGFIFDMKEIGNLSLPIMYFPGWEVWESGSRLKTGYDENGFLVISPENKSGSLSVKYASTKVERIADLISLVSILAVIVYLPLYGKRKI